MQLTIFICPQVITNPKFKNNIQQLSNQMRDTLLSPLDSAVYWLHYSIRNKGCNYLKSHSMHLYWFQVRPDAIWPLYSLLVIEKCILMTEK